MPTPLLISLWIQAGNAVWVAILTLSCHIRIHRERFVPFWALSFLVGGIALAWQLAILAPRADAIHTSEAAFLFGIAQFPLLALAALLVIRPAVRPRAVAVTFSVFLAALIAVELAVTANTGPVFLARARHLEQVAIHGGVYALFCLALLQAKRFVGTAGGALLLLSGAVSAFNAGLVALSLTLFPAIAPGYTLPAAWVDVLAPAGMALGIVLFALRSARRSTQVAREAEERFHLLVDNIHQIFWILDLAPPRFVYVSPAFERIWNMPGELLLRDTYAFLDRLHPADRDRIEQLFRASLETATGYETEFRIVRPAEDHPPEICWIRSRAFLATGEGERPARQVGIAEDITDRVRAEAALRDSEQLFRSMFEAAPLAIAFVDSELRLTRINPALQKMVGRPNQEIVGKTLADISHPDDLSADVSLARRVFSGELPAYSMNKRFIRPDGQTVWAKLAVFGVRIGGTIRYLLGMAVDITDQKRAENKLHDLTARLLTSQDEERRRIARELHDSLGQDLAAIRLNLARIGDAELPAGCSAVLEDSTAIAEKMLREIRTLSYLLHPPLLDELGLVSAVRAYLDGVSERSGMRIDSVLPDSMPRLARDLELAIFRIVQEAVTNVHRHSGSTWCRVIITYTGRAVTVEIRDDGTGLPADLLEGNVESFSDVGVGISGMRERARHLRGTLRFESANPGSVVIAEFPVS